MTRLFAGKPAGPLPTRDSVGLSCSCAASCLSAFMACAGATNRRRHASSDPVLHSHATHRFSMEKEGRPRRLGKAPVQSRRRGGLALPALRLNW